MPEVIKNKPKTQQEVTNNNTEPYISGSKPYLDIPKRGNDVSLRGETIKDVSNSFENIVEGIMYYFREVIKPSVMEDDTKVNIPVIYAEPERWKSAQKDGYFRDKEGQILFPVIAFKIENIEKDRTLGSKLDGNKVNQYQVYEVKYTPQNFYDNFSTLTNRVPVKKFRSLIVPDYYNITINCIIQTSMVTDILKMIEDIGYKSDSYWGEPNKFQYKARIDSFPITQELLQGEDRRIETRFTINLHGHIIPDSINKFLSTDYNKFYSKAQVRFKVEMVGGMEIFNTTAPKPSSVVNNYIKPKATVVSGSIDPLLLIYLNTNKEVKASFNSGSTAIFSGSFLSAPSPLPATSKTSFTYFVNGPLLEMDAVTSFVDNGNGTVTLTVDTAEAGYTLKENWEVIAIGKFQ